MNYQSSAPGLLERLRTCDVASRVGAVLDPDILGRYTASGVRFVASTPRMEQRHDAAVRELVSCIKPSPSGPAILNEGGIYFGCWLESTGTINAELLSRFIPDVAADTFAGFARHQRADGLLPYKLTADGPVFSQIQTVTPLARSVWTHYCLNGRDKAWLAPLYAAMAANDDWLAQWRDTRGTGAVEAFCTFDTGHDLSARFWHVPDSPYNNDPKAWHPDNPILPFIAPDLTANVACQRLYLARMAAELDKDAQPWRDKATASTAALYAQCFEAEDGFFYDRDRHGRHVRVQSDVLLRVLACEIGDDDFFDRALERYLLNTAKFFAKYPLTSLALDDARYDAASDHNSWSGPTNFLTLIRTPHAFETHHRHVELSWIVQPTLSALFRAGRFPQTLNPFSGEAGFTEAYSPAILCLLDFIEKLCGIEPRPDDSLWFTGLTPQQIEHRDIAHETGYGRTVDGQVFELINTATHMAAYRDETPLFSAPRGIRVITDRQGQIKSLVGMSASPVAGELTTGKARHGFAVGPNEQLDFQGDRLVRVRDPRLIAPTY